MDIHCQYRNGYSLGVSTRKVDKLVLSRWAWRGLPRLHIGRAVLGWRDLIRPARADQVEFPPETSRVPVLRGQQDSTSSPLSGSKNTRSQGAELDLAVGEVLRPLTASIGQDRRLEQGSTQQPRVLNPRSAPIPFFLDDTLQPVEEVGVEVTILGRLIQVGRGACHRSGHQAP